MRAMNQYSNYIYEYKLEHGEDPYVLYKQAEDESVKQSIEDWLFSVCREVNEVPQKEWNDQQIYNSIKILSETDSSSVYHDNSYGYSAVGVDVLNQFFPELLDVRKPTAPLSIREAFNNDDFLRRVIKKNLTYDKSERGLFRFLLLCGAGYCVNFRPATAKALYETFGKSRADGGCKVLDSSAGYGARLLGAHFAENVTEYVGIDPNTKEHCDDVIEYLDTHFGEKLSNITKKKVLKMGSEDFTTDRFPEYKEYFDLYFTSPPYFNTEMYSQDESQSYKKFPTYRGWVRGFYRSTIHNACDALKKDGIFAINIFEKVPNIKEFTKAFLAEKGWIVFQTDKYLMHSMPGKAYDEDGNELVGVSKNTLQNNFEPIWYAKHYTQLYREGKISKEEYQRFVDKGI